MVALQLTFYVLNHAKRYFSEKHIGSLFYSLTFVTYLSCQYVFLCETFLYENTTAIH